MSTGKKRIKGVKFKYCEFFTPTEPEYFLFSIFESFSEQIRARLHDLGEVEHGRHERGAIARNFGKVEDLLKRSVQRLVRGQRRA